jgi:transposase
LLAIKLFELDTSVREAARQFGLAYNTAYRLHHLLRTAIQCTAEDAASQKGEIKPTNHILEDGEKDNGDVELQARYQSSVSSNEGGRYGLRSYRM